MEAAGGLGKMRDGHELICKLNIGQMDDFP